MKKIIFNCALICFVTCVVVACTVPTSKISEDTAIYFDECSRIGKRTQAIDIQNIPETEDSASFTFVEVRCI